MDDCAETAQRIGGDRVEGSTVDLERNRGVCGEAGAGDREKAAWLPGGMIDGDGWRNTVTKEGLLRPDCPTLLRETKSMALSVGAIIFRLSGLGISIQELPSQCRIIPSVPTAQPSVGEIIFTSRR
jgi:hypothetical protein